MNERAGLSFASTLRSVLRQDPDVIMVGEIRDLETAEIAFQASLTGHLVFSTLHTNDTIAAITRLLDLGIEPFLAASSVSLIVAQRVFEFLPIDAAMRELIAISVINQGRGIATVSRLLHPVICPVTSPATI